jgi:hypothetical protein
LKYPQNNYVWFGRVQFFWCSLHLEEYGLSCSALQPLTIPADINLTELQKSLDAQGVELVDNQKESVIGRKALADKTKGMRIPL